MYSELFSPLQIGSLTLKNRITQAPLYTGYANEDGTVSQSILDHYAKGSRGGAALVVVEAASVSAGGVGLKNGIRAYKDKYIPGLLKLARGIKDNGALACIQLCHAGRYALDRPPLSASAIPFRPAPGVTITPKEMTIEEIKEVIGDFASAARRVKQAGFDMLELHGATGYLIVQFLSPLTNKRTDQYGGDLENRLRFSLEVVDAVKEAVGTDFPIGMRFLADDLLPGGFGLEDARVLARCLDDKGVAYLSITGGVYDSIYIPEIQKKIRVEGSLVHLAEEIKGCVKKTCVLAGNRINNPGLAQEIVRSGKADGVALGRPLLRDPDFSNKAREGHPEDIHQCIGCNGCAGLAMKGKRVVCIQEYPEAAKD